MDAELDELIGRAARSLGRLPAANPRAAARIMAAVRTRRSQPRSVFSLFLDRVRQPSLSMAGAGALAAAALILGFISRPAIESIGPTGTIAQEPIVASQPGEVVQASASHETRPVPVAIVFEARNAKSVSIVGDFNGWDATKSPMKRFGDSGPWTVSVSVKPGRHVYAFLVDGSTLVADPRAPRARDLDFGGDASVLMVTNP